MEAFPASQLKAQTGCLRGLWDDANGDWQQRISPQVK